MNYKQLREEIKRELSGELFDFQSLVSLTVDQKKARLSELLGRASAKVQKRNKLKFTEEEDSKLKEQIISEMLGYGVLESVLKDPDVSDIFVNSPSQIFAEKHGKLERLNVSFDGTEDVMTVIERMMSGSGGMLNQANPFVDFNLEDGSRVTAVIPPVASRSPSLAIRKFTNAVFDSDELINQGMFSKKMLLFFEACILAKLNILVCGQTGAGKTTLMNTLLKFVPSTERIVLIEDVQELVVPEHQHFLKLLMRSATLEGNLQISMQDLVKLSLHLRPDRIVIGEVRGEESFDLLQAMNTGHEGSMCTLHANNAEDALSRLEMLMLVARPNVQPYIIRKFLGMGIDLVVHVERSLNGKRELVQVSEVVYADKDAVVKDIFSIVSDFSSGEEKRSLQFTGYVPTFMQKVKSRVKVTDEILMD